METYMSSYTIIHLLVYVCNTCMQYCHHLIRNAFFIIFSHLHSKPFVLTTKCRNSNFNTNENLHFSITTHMTKTALNFVWHHIPTSGILSKKQQGHKTSVLTNQKKAHMTFKAAVSEKLTPYKFTISPTEENSTRQALVMDSTTGKLIQTTSSYSKALWTVKQPVAAEINS